MKPTAPPEHCAIRLRMATSNLTHRLRSTGRGDEISIAKLSVLGQIYRSGPLTATEIAKLEGVKPQSLTRLLAELEAEDWIARQPHPTDGRQSILSLTRLGSTNLMRRLRRREAALSVAIEAHLSAAEQALLLKACALIDHIAQALEPARDAADI